MLVVCLNSNASRLIPPSWAAIQTANGQIYPIDPVIQRITAEFAQFLREEPYTINLAH